MSLYDELAKAYAQPSRAFRDVSAALQIPEQGLAGYKSGLDYADEINSRKLKNQTLSQALGGNVPDRIAQYGNLRVPVVKDLGGLDAIAKITENPVDEGKFLDTAQAKQFGLPDEFIATFKGRPIRREIAQGYMSNKARSEIAGSLQKRTETGVANAINKNVNSLTSGTGALATAGKNNLRIARVKSLLERPTALTPQEMELVTTDLAGVVQGGVPLKDTVEGQAIGTVAAKFADMMKNVSNNPQTFNDMGFRKRIIQLANEMIDADNLTQSKALNVMKATYGHLTTPEHLSRIEQAIRSNQQLPIIEPDMDGSSIQSLSDEELRSIAGDGQE